MYTIVDDDQRVTQAEMNDSEILSGLDSGFISAILRLNNNVIEFANVNGTTDTVEWVVPK